MERVDDRKSGVAVWSGIALAVLAASYCAFTAIHINSFVSLAKPATSIQSPPRLQKFIWMEIMLTVTALLMVKTAVSAARGSSPQRKLFSESNPVAHFLWALCGGYILLVYYP